MRVLVGEHTTGSSVLVIRPTGEVENLTALKVVNTPLAFYGVSALK